MSKPWKPGKTTVALNPPPRPSRIRREPVTLVGPPKRRPAPSRERELLGGIAGVLLFTGLIATAIIALSIFTVFRADPAAEARTRQFTQCYNAIGPNCVLDGDTIYVQRQRVEVAGMDAPRIEDARCDDERSRGIAAAVALANLLNSGRVAVGPPFADELGRTVRKVTVKGGNVAYRMIDQGLAHEAGSVIGWCG